MADECDYIEVKAYTDPIYKGKAEKIVKQGVRGVLCGGPIAASARTIFDEANIWYRDNVEPDELEVIETENEDE